jgi:hypothetical protein
MVVATIESELQEDLEAAGFEIRRVISRPISRDGVERRALPEAVDLVKNVLVMTGDELDPETARTLLQWVFGWLRLRRENGEAGDVRYVSVYGPDGKSVLLTVPVPKD